MSVAWRQRRIPMPWGRMSVQLSGEGPPLLLLHGLGGSGRYWAGLAPSLASSRLLIAPDLAGFGRSDKPRVDYTRDFHLDTLDSLLAALRVDGAVDVAGHSMGGILASLWARRRAAMVRSLAIIASPFPREHRHTAATRVSRPRRVVYRALQRLLPVLSPLVRSATYPRAVVADYLRHTADSYRQTSNALIWDPAAATALAGLDMALSGRPQLLLFSDEDTTIDAGSRERWRTALPGAEVVLMAGAHQLLLPDGFATLAAWYQARVVHSVLREQCTAL
ncbi:MAG TPA: alpha/beta fold hydrolase [Candidatus Dormibacteraeota bacterium]|nr:alpha/beta fold hydrolase [Candidatus Dormibacteraeota bacterium]